VLGYLQRGGVPSPYDRLLATAFGTEAAAMLNRGDFGKMVCLSGERIGAVPLSEVAGKIKPVPRDHRLIRTARLVGTCMGDD